MRMPKYLSPTSLMKWQENPENYYLEYLADNRPPRFPQTQPMSVGSSFDAYTKSYLHERLFGKNNNPEFEFDTLFKGQVEEHNRDWALDAGKYVFEAYIKSGALADLSRELEQAQKEPRFEFRLEEEIEGVNLLGKPDLFYTHKSGTPIILDWKVNGFCSKRPTSPKRGYLRIRDGWGREDAPSSRNAGDMHKDAHPMKHNGVNINCAEFLETVNKQWGLQLATYAWLCGAEIGSDFIVALDQIVAKPRGGGLQPLLRVAEHRLLIGPDFQRQCLRDYQSLWEIIQSDHIFRELSLEESVARCCTLDLQHKAFKGSGDDALDSFAREMAGR